MNTIVPQHRNSPAKQHPLENLFAILFRGRWIILIMLAVAMLASVVWSLLAKNVYQASSSVLIDPSHTQTLRFSDAGNGIVPTNIIQNELEILKSRFLAKSVAAKLIEQRYLDTAKHTLIPIIQIARKGNKGDTIADVNVIADRLLGAITFESVRQSDVIRISTKRNDPEEAALLANVYARGYSEENLHGSRSRSRSLREFLEGQKREKESALTRAEDSLRTYMQVEGVVSLDDESKKVVNQLSVLESERGAIDVELQSLTQTVKSYKDQIAGQETDAAKVMGEANDPYIRLLQEQLAQLEVQLDVRVAQNAESAKKEVQSEQLKSLRDQAATLKANLKKRTEQFLRTLLPSGQTGSEQNDPVGYLRQAKQKLLELQIQTQSLEAKKGALDKAIARYDRQFRLIPQKSLDYARLERQKMSQERLYVMLEEKFNEAKIAEQSRFGYIDVFDPAVVPDSPTGPSIFVNLLMGLIAGLGMGVAVVMVRESLLERVNKPEDLHELGLLPLVTITNMRDELRTFKGRTKEVIDNKAIDVELIIITKPASPASESYRHLRATVQMGQRNNPPKTILITSPGQGEGKSTTSSNLAAALAETEQDVLLVDTDFRRPSLHTAFNLAMKPGLSDLLESKISLDQVVQHTVQPNLHFISCGSVPSTTAKLLRSNNLKMLVDKLKSRYAVVVFDSAPILAVTDGLVLSSMMDSILMVVSAGNTSVPAIRKAVEVFEAVGVKSVGIVLNNFDVNRGYGLKYDRSAYGYYGYSEERSGDGPDVANKT